MDRLVDIGSLTLHVRDWGGGDAPPLFLVHGLASTHRMFDLIAEPLTRRYHVFAYDQRGHGLSDKPDDGYDFETIAGDLDRLAEALGVADRPLVVIGHSWGAYTALYYAATRPERTAKTVLIDGGLWPVHDSLPTWAEAEVAMTPPTYRGITVDGLKVLIRNWLGDAFRPELEPLAESVFDLSDPNDIHARLSPSNHMQIARALWAFTPTDYFPQVRCPLLVVNAVPASHTSDAQMQEYARQAESLAPDVRVVWMPDTIHDIPWHRPRELVDVLDGFL
ncbi:MAG: alpha/beta hydrolase [Chloroflexi bacterium]|nr:alpha/beta hydrolase [Chloroflexota bacterium]